MSVTTDPLCPYGGYAAHCLACHRGYGEHANEGAALVVKDIDLKTSLPLSVGKIKFEPLWCPNCKNVERENRYQRRLLKGLMNHIGCDCRLGNPCWAYRMTEALLKRKGTDGSRRRK